MIDASRSNRAILPEIELLPGVTPADVTLTRVGADLLLGIAGDAGSLRVLGFFVDTTSFAVNVGMIDHNITRTVRALGGEAPERGLHGKLSPDH